MDRTSNDGKVYADEFEKGLSTIKMLSIEINLTASCYRGIKDRAKGYFVESEFISYCWRMGLTTVKERPKEMEDLIEMLSGSLALEQLNALFPFGNSNTDL